MNDISQTISELYTAHSEEIKIAAVAAIFMAEPAYKVIKAGINKVGYWIEEMDKQIAEEYKRDPATIENLLIQIHPLDSHRNLL